ncbi:hypothetical protein JCGZ_11989 [Jatropha curcas]|uniref:Bifunctional inhibitor/plant lipid transfer protein/seed storage helical domain-containing protein n=1 Tax=Jatropha curcas TaxID=180498 RepID=A0A067K9B6_JATCU|nr:non-specific lipid-transfer protein-like protein At2g13820 [Jatropha curcas]KDP32697.1 hypothetical protein JCGZ_11989 [Jatropha curcas]
MRFLFFSLILALLANCSHSRHYEDAQSPAESPSSGVDCSIIIYDMVDCLPYMTGSGAPLDASCCAGFESVLHFNTKCVCEALKTSLDMNLDINLTKAYDLPKDCKVSTPPSHCNVSTMPPSHAAPVGPPQSSPKLPPAPIEAPKGSVRPPSAERGSAPTKPDLAAPAPSGGAYSISISLLALISQLLVSFSFTLAN